MVQTDSSSPKRAVPRGEEIADEEFQATEALQRAARIDPVSGLRNRRQFVEDFGFGVSATTEQNCDVIALLTLASPEQFNGIVRALGHGFAEEVVRLGVERLRNSLPADKRIYHIDPLSFAFAIPANDGDMVPEALEDMVAIFAEPLLCNGIPIRNQIGLGLNRAGDSGSDPSEILRGALVAAQDSLNRSQTSAWYDRGSDQAHLRSFRLLADLGRLMHAPDEVIAAQFSLHYQPKIDLRTGGCCGVEGLMRWTHPSLGFVSPAEFITLAEATAVITPLTRWVFRQGVSQRATWHRDGIDARISLNVSPINLGEPDFADFVLETCREQGVAPEWMEIEFTESAQTMDSALTLAQLSRLRDEGVRVAIDDFGSGYSNMRYLRSIPADALKIDKDFILTLDTEEKNRKIVPTIIDLGHQLGFAVVAEGIETADSYNTLADWGCDEGQGFFMSKPLTEGAFRDWYGATKSRKVA